MVIFQWHVFSFLEGKSPTTWPMLPEDEHRMNVKMTVSAWWFSSSRGRSLRFQPFIFPGCIHSINLSPNKMCKTSGVAQQDGLKNHQTPRVFFPSPNAVFAWFPEGRGVSGTNWKPGPSNARDTLDSKKTHKNPLNSSLSLKKIPRNKPRIFIFYLHINYIWEK